MEFGCLFRQAFEEVKTKGKAIEYFYDNIFVYSDMQTGHGKLYGLRQEEYLEYRANNSHYIDVLKLIETYRRLINPKVNVFMVQVAKYADTVIPETLYRSHILAGWTGAEVMYATKMNEMMDQIDVMKEKIQKMTIV